MIMLMLFTYVIEFKTLDRLEKMQKVQKDENLVLEKNM